MISRRGRSIISHILPLDIITIISIIRIDISAELYNPSNFHMSASSSEERPSQRWKRKRLRKNIHSWTEEDFNILTHLQHLHRWRYKQIQISFFPSLLTGALSRAYWHLSPEERAWRASVVNSSTAEPECSRIKQGPCHLYPPIYATPSTSRSESITDISTTSSRDPKDESVDYSVVTNQSRHHYNLRPNRPTAFLRKQPRYLVNHHRFPHFFKSYKDSLDQEGLPDRDYSPPPHTPTLDPSDHSPSVISTQLSSASSLELFGLEPRTPSSSNRESSIDRRSDTSSLNYFSAEEQLPSS
jgi:hypothetical protein